MLINNKRESQILTGNHLYHFYTFCIYRQQKHLAKRNGYYWQSYIGQHWDEFSLDHIRTRSVHIEVLEVYSSYNNGFIEVEFYTGISLRVLDSILSSSGAVSWNNKIPLNTPFVKTLDTLIDKDLRLAILAPVVKHRFRFW